MKTLRTLKVIRNLRVIKYLAFFLVLVSLSGCLTLGGGGTQIVKKDEPAPSQVKVFFATDRAPVSGGDYFGSERGDLSFGVANVSIPPGHLMGRHEEPSLYKFEWSPDEHKHIKLHSVNTLKSGEFTQRLIDAVEQSPEGKVMIFVHGYNVDFKESARVVAQFAKDLKFRGPVILFSWPSRGSLTGYSVDSTNAEWASSHFLKLLNAMLDKIPAKDIYLIAHSMGNRIVGSAVTALASDRPAEDLGKIRELIMIAPDIDADVFRKNMAPRLARTGIHITLYASSNDRALMASKAFNGYPRAGEAGEGLVIVDGVETIDASSISSGLLGHSYFAEDRRVMEDIFSLLQTGQRADDRFALGAVERGGKRYWTFRQ